MSALSALSVSPRRLPRLLAPAAALMLLAASVLHAGESISITLDGSAEVPPVITAATGSGEITVLPDRTVNGRIKVSGMVPTMAHIHEGAIDRNGPAIITLVPTGEDGFAVPPDARLSESEYASFIAGKLYVNVHSAKHPSGEIRAQLLRMKVATRPPGAAD